MPDIDRREFLTRIGIGTAGIVAAGSVLSLASCSSPTKKETAKLAALRVSSDIYKTDLVQRFAFSIFDQDSQVASEGSIPITLTSPSGKTQKFGNVHVREKGISGNGIYSVMALLAETGSWTMNTEFRGQQLELSFSVTENNIAPGLGTICPNGITPTTSAPLDATILCTRFKGDCGLHSHSVPELLATKKPFIVIFATPARCQTTYCGPVLDLTRNIADKHTSIPVIHVEIYKDETSNDLLEAVNAWGLQTEPWLFGISAEGTIDSRLDGAFDQSEIEETFTRLAQ